MAIYRTGTASLNAQGVIVGVGTNWQDKLSLVRVGATMIFQTAPLTICTISSIVSPTEMRATATDGAVVAAGTKYVILLHDSITVDGLAQDVAETLRYYQSKETVIEDAIEFFQNFDWERIVAIGNQVKADAQTASTAATNAKTSETNSKASENAAKASQTAAAASQAAAKASETNAKASETAAKTSQTAAAGSATAAASSASAASGSATAAKTSETNAKTSETNANSSKVAAAASQTAAAGSASAASGSATAAKTSETNAKTSETNAASSKTAAAASATTATQQADRAKAEADRAASANPDNQLKKANNLSDVANLETSRTNMQVNRLVQRPTETSVLTANASYRLVITDAGVWGGYQEGANWRALGIAQGGTGSLSESGARSNLESPWSRKSGLGSDVNLNTLTGYANVGWHPQPSSANATAANNYPTQNAGTLQVMYSGANGANECTQIYYPYNGDEYYKRRGMPSGSTVNWTNWKTFADTDVASARVNDRLTESGINTTGSINQNDANNLQYNGFFAGAGVGGVNFKNAYGPGLVMRRVNDVYQIQWSAEGRMSVRSYVGGSWGSWGDSILAGDFGVGVSDVKPPTTQGGSFIADSNGSTTWAPANGGGFQSAYANSRLFQAFITPSNAFYIRYNDSGAPQATRAAKPWTQMQAVGTSDANFKDVKGNFNVEAALDNVNRLEFKLFKYTFDDPTRSARRGVIAQQAMTVDREYVHSAETAGIMTLDLNPLLMDSMAAIKALRARDVENKDRIAKLESDIEDLKTMIAALAVK